MSPPKSAPRTERLNPRTAPTEDASAVRRRALAIWPRLDPAALRRAGEDVDRVAAIVERRSSLPRESIVGMLRSSLVSDDEAATWFG